MEKKYQVFVSSTYEDLIEERQEVMHALLELDCIPSGMELFPAADDETWELIKSVIDECDYYLLILAGRYGSGYTKREYQYAQEIGKPIVAFLHKAPETIQQQYTEQNREAREKLEKFRALVQKKMCKYWGNPSELGSVASRSLVSLIKKHPGTGWVKGDLVTSQDAAKEILSLRRKIEDLEGQLNAARTQAPAGTENLAQGMDKFSAHYSFIDTRSWNDRITYTGEARYSWNDLFYEISPLLINEADEWAIRNALGNMLFDDLLAGITEQFDADGTTYYDLGKFSIKQDDFQTIKVQFSALGLITQSVKNRSVKDSGTYWTLTPYGVEIMTRLRAIQKAEIVDKSQPDNSIVHSKNEASVDPL